MLLKIFWLLCPGLISVAHCFHHAAVRPVHTRSPFQLQSSILTDDIVFAPSEVEDTGRLVAIGDVHGDMKCLHRCLRIAGLMDNKGHWSGGNSVCVQVGDIFDRGDDDYYILQKIHQLNEEAQEQGGALISILGNHEVMSIRANHKFVTPRSCIPFLDMKQELDEFLEGDWSAFEHLPELERCRAAAFMPGGILSKKMALHPAVIKVGSTLFCHGGLAPGTLAAYGGTVGGAADAASLWIQGLGPFPEELLGGKPGSETIIWNRAYSMPESKELADAAHRAALEATLALTGCERMVVGHTPQQVGINSAADGKVWRIDTGLSEFYGGPTEVLEILDGHRASILRDAKYHFHARPAAAHAVPLPPAVAAELAPRRPLKA